MSLSGFEDSLFERHYPSGVRLPHERFFNCPRSRDSPVTKATGVESGSHRILPLDDSGDFSVSLAERGSSPTNSSRHVGGGPPKTGVLATAHGCSGTRGRYARILECDPSRLLYLSALWILRLLGVPSNEFGHGRID